MTILLATSLLSSTASATSCAAGVYDIGVDDPSAVPVNAEFLLAHSFFETDEITVVLTDGLGEAVPATLAPLHTGYSVLVPDEPLAENADYTLTTDVFVDFTTSATVDDEAPAIPEIVDTTRLSNDEPVGGTDHPALRVEVLPIDGASHYQFEIAEDEDFTRSEATASLHPTAYLGFGPCGDSISGYAPDEDAYVRARSVDQAGNASAWSDAVFVLAAVDPDPDPMEPTSANCNTAGGALGGSWLLLALTALARRRRA